MLRLALRACLTVLASRTMAQPVPGRDLWTYPIGLVADAPALGIGAASGLWNPATALLRSGERGRIAAGALNSPVEISLTGQALHGAIRYRGGTWSLGIGRAAITGLAHTETDPQSSGPDIQYNSLIVSAGYARRVHEHFVAGAALRLHTGHVFQARRSMMVTDVGFVADGLTRFDIRLAGSTFLFGLDGDATPTVGGAVDAKLYGKDSTETLRGGAAITRTRHSVGEFYPYLELRARKIGVRGGAARLSAFGSESWRMRLGVLLMHSGYTIAVAREENASGLAPTYQLSVANVFR